jgi:hypothetical protein
LEEHLQHKFAGFAACTHNIGGRWLQYDGPPSLQEEISGRKISA